MYYCPDIASGVLPEEESAHCVQVLRAHVGDTIDVTDGVGGLYHCEVTNPHRRHCEFRVLSEEHPAPLHTSSVHVAVAPTKMMERIEWFVEKATEIGIDRITLLRCDHSERKEVKLERLQRIMIAAAKQSLRTTFPVISEMTPCADFLRTQAEAQGGVGCYIAHCAEGYAPTEGRYYLADNLRAAENSTLQPSTFQPLETTILIGPEGDFSPAEIETAKAAGWIPVSLGPTRLRTETAALVAAHTAILYNT